MSENEEDRGKPKVPPPTLSKPPAEPPPPSMAGGMSSPPPPPSPAPPPAPTGGAELPKVRVKPGSGDDDEEGEATTEPHVPLGTRVAGFLIDVGISTGLFIGLVIIMPGFLEKLAWPVALAYMLFRDGLPFLNGQSVGKTAMKTKAVTLDGASLAGNWNPALIRNVVLLIPVFPLVELIVLLTREDKSDQGIRLGDEWAKTKVIPVAVRGGAAEDEAEEKTEGENQAEES